MRPWKLLYFALVNFEYASWRPDPVLIQIAKIKIKITDSEDCRQISKSFIMRNIGQPRYKPQVGLVVSRQQISASAPVTPWRTPKDDI